MTDPRSRPFTRLASQILGGNALSNLDSGKCPTCGQHDAVDTIRDQLSMKEFGISGMCQKCQDSVFGGAQND